MTTLQRKATNPHARLATLAAGLRTGTLGPEDRELLADAIEQVARGADAAAVLGLKRRPGQRMWATYATLAERDGLLRDAAACFLGGCSVAEQARRLHTELLRYHASAWLRERTLDQCPTRHVGNMHEFLWRALKVHDHVPAARSLRLILAKS
jgi:hypothetical protein